MGNKKMSGIHHFNPTFHYSSLPIFHCPNISVISTSL
jgi:hypothetical protein